MPFSNLFKKHLIFVLNYGIIFLKQIRKENKMPETMIKTETKIRPFKNTNKEKWYNFRAEKELGKLIDRYCDDNDISISEFLRQASYLIALPPYIPEYVLMAGDNKSAENRLHLVADTLKQLKQMRLKMNNTLNLLDKAILDFESRAGIVIHKTTLDLMAELAIEIRTKYFKTLFDKNKEKNRKEQDV